MGFNYQISLVSAQKAYVIFAYYNQSTFVVVLLTKKPILKHMGRVAFENLFGYFGKLLTMGGKCSGCQCCFDHIR